jgi:signal transduction histidine kinase
MVEVKAQLKTKYSYHFTTRKDGAGIGLSKNIIEAHGGYLSHQTDSDDLSGGKTHFTICFILEIVKTKDLERRFIT